MIVPDVNLLVYTVDVDSPLQKPAQEWLEGAFAGTETIGFIWNVLLGFVRITTRSAALPRKLTVEQALELVALWLIQPCATVIQPGPRHFELLRGLLTSVGRQGILLRTLTLLRLQWSTTRLSIRTIAILTASPDCAGIIRWKSGRGQNPAASFRPVRLQTRGPNIQRRVLSVQMPVQMRGVNFGDFRRNAPRRKST